MQAKRVGHRGRTLLVEWRDWEGVPRRALVPPEHVGDDWVDDAVLARCPGDPMVEMLEARLAGALPDPQALKAYLRASRRRGLWTPNDGVARPAEVRAAYDEALGSAITAIMNAHRELAG